MGEVVEKIYDEIYGETIAIIKSLSFQGKMSVAWFIGVNPVKLDVNDDGLSDDEYVKAVESNVENAICEKISDFKNKSESSEEYFGLIATHASAMTAKLYDKIITESYNEKSE